MPRVLMYLLLVAPLVGAAADTANTPLTSSPENPQTATPSATPSQLQEQASEAVEALQEPLYSPFIERYVLDELKQLRVDMAAQKHELMQQVLDREHKAVDRGVTYATDTITYFFYLIAAASSVLVLVGWNSFRDIKERVHTFADDEISKLVSEYESRLERIEQQMKQKSRHIKQNREELEITQEVQSLWLRAQQENSPSHQIPIYDQILKLKPDNCEAMTYKADAVLELGEPQWAINLCHQALAIDQENSHAFYQLACAHTSLKQFDEAVRYLSKALDLTDTYREQLETDAALWPLHEYEPFVVLCGAAGEKVSLSQGTT